MKSERTAPRQDRETCGLRHPQPPFVRGLSEDTAHEKIVASGDRSEASRPCPDLKLRSRMGVVSRPKPTLRVTTVNAPLADGGELNGRASFLFHFEAELGLVDFALEIERLAMLTNILPHRFVHVHTPLQRVEPSV